LVDRLGRHSGTLGCAFPPAWAYLPSGVYLAARSNRQTRILASESRARAWLL
jgi:hypothetical protein